MTRKAKAPADELGLGDDPLMDSDPLVTTFYQRARDAISSVPAGLKIDDADVTATRRRKAAKGRQPLREGQSFRLVTFSFSEEDVARLDALLQEAKRTGHKRVSRSQIVRLALRAVDLSDLPEQI